MVGIPECQTFSHWLCINQLQPLNILHTTRRAEQPRVTASLALSPVLPEGWKGCTNAMKCSAVQPANTTPTPPLPKCVGLGTQAQRPLLQCPTLRLSLAGLTAAKELLVPCMGTDTRTHHTAHSALQHTLPLPRPDPPRPHPCTHQADEPKPADSTR